MNITNVKAMVAKVFTIGALAGAVVLASPSKAQAQVSFGIHVGTPVRQVYAPSYGYVQPAYGYAQPRYDDERYEARRRYEYQRQQAYLRAQQHEQWEQRERWEQHERHEQQERAEHGYYGYNR